ncbi:integrase [Pseudomonas putida]|uniref:integrase n=1 Tax=Pseudomonas putida TaxID=303 RepID=UPI0039E1BD92
MALEKMLNWSFANEVSMIDLTRDDFIRYADFIAKPDPRWCTPGVQARFISDAQHEFRDWAINPAWLPFKLSRTSGSENEIEKNVWKREIRIVTQFLNYYLQDVGANRPNVAKAPLPHLVFKQSTAREVLSDAEMTWVIRNLERLMTSHDFQSTEMYLTIARYSSQQMERVIGSSTRPGRLNQFILDEDGRWLERKTDGRGWRRLSTAFDEVFNRYLNYLNIDSHGLLPSIPIFPGDNSKGAIGLKGLRNILNSTRETLGQLADASSSPEIRGAAKKFRELSTSLARSSWKT